MDDDDLRARLEGHTKTFEGLMSLIPADQYYGKDNSNQWNAKKQTKEQKRLAKRAKLDPSNPTSALDVHRENERKRKREEATDGGDTVSVDTDLQERPREGMKVKQPKKQKVETDSEAAAEKKRIQREEKKKRNEAKKEKQLAKKQAKKTQKPQQAKAATTNGKPASATTNDLSRQDGDQSGEQESEDSDAEEAGVDELEKIDFSNLNGGSGDEDHDTPDSSTRHSPTFDAQHSSASSSSSIGTPALTAATGSKPVLKVNTPAAAATEDDEESGLPDASVNSSPRQKRERAFTLPQVDQSVLQARLAARIEALRAARKADTINGKPAKNRQELIEARRRKEEQRRAHKKELRAKARVAKDAEEEAARLRGGSGSPLWTTPAASPRTEANHFEFGRVAFTDGAEMDASLSRVVDPRKKKGPQDAKTALNTVQKKQDRLKQLDDEKRADVEEKDRWLGAKKRIHGEKIRDDASLLKKTLKRKEKMQSKSEKEWTDRVEGVRAAKEAKQRKREKNLQERRDSKGIKGKAAKKQHIKKKRPGFEGSFKAGSRRS